jgi:triosephosphate isomerase
MIKPRKLIAGNWKMNGLLQEGRALAGELRRRLDGAGTIPFDLAVFPPATLVLPIAELLRGSAIAIGTGLTATPNDVAEIHGLIRRTLNRLVPDASGMRILYGGSVKPQNAAELLAVPDVDGALVGGSSLKAKNFWGIAAFAGPA